VLQGKKDARYNRGLHTYYPGDWQGRGYFLFADTGRRYPATTWVASRAGQPWFDSEPLVLPSWDDEDEDADRYWGRLAIRDPFRESVDTFLRAALEASRDRRIFVVCEYSGDVTRYRGERPLTGDEDVCPNPEALLLGPLTRRGFWQEHDAKRITIPSLIAVEEDREQ
jgi:hypothetical protein